MVETFKQLNF